MVTSIYCQSCTPSYDEELIARQSRLDYRYSCAKISIQTATFKNVFIYKINDTLFNCMHYICVFMEYIESKMYVFVRSQISYSNGFCTDFWQNNFSVSRLS